MRRFSLFALAVLVAAGLWSQTRDLELSIARRMALVIGNDAYEHAPPLRNAVNDAQDLAAALEAVGFDTTVVLDADEETLESEILRFTGSIQQGDVALVHFSGHGIQIEGDNYLIPIDFNERDEVGAKHHAYSATELHARISDAGARLKILTLDACRNNRFRSFRGGPEGLSAMSVRAEGSYMAFATAPGQVASDNPDGRNGLFTGALLTALLEPGLELDQVFRKVRQVVYDLSGGAQLPWVNTSVLGEFYFRPGEASAGHLAVTRIDASPSPGVESTPRAEPPPADRQPGDVITADIHGVPMEFVWIPPGEFEMGCSPGDDLCQDQEKPRHRVRLSQGFEMSRYEVTQAQWLAVMGSNPSQFQDPTRPVEKVAWETAKRFFDKLNAARDGYRYRFPTEAEWEYAARAGETSARYGEIDAVSWHRDNGKRQSHPVGGKAPNAWGLYDMLGNVWEWCQDPYDAGYYPVSPEVDPQGPSEGAARVIRGGSFSIEGKFLRLSTRLRYGPADRGSGLGFRCVRVAYR